MTRITAFALRHKRLVVLFWVAMAVAGAMTAGLTTSRMTNSFSMSSQAATTDARIVAEYGSGSDTPLVAVVTAPAGQRITDAAATAITAQIFGAARVTPAVRVVDYANTHNPGFITGDGRSTYALAFLPTANYDGTGGIDSAVTAAVQAATPAGWHTGFTSITLLSTPATPQQGQGTSVLVEAMVGGLGALVVLAVVFASFLAFLPLLMGAISVLSTFLLVLGLTTFTGVSTIVTFLIGLIGLGVAIDYSLLVVTRWREERARGLDNNAAVQAAMTHAGRAVVFSGLTVAIGLLALVVLRVPMLQSVGYGGVLVPLVSVAVAITLLPVLLATVGPRLDWPRLRSERSASRVWTAWARGIYGHRWPAAILGTAILGLLAFPALSLQLGEPASTSLSTSGPARDALATLTSGGVPSGILTPIQVLTTASATAVEARLTHVNGIHAVAVVPSPQAGGGTLVTVLPVAESSLGAGQDTVRAVQVAVASDPSVAGVGGDGAGLIDFDNAVYGNFPLMLALIAIGTFLLLARAFRSVLLALKAVVFNLVSLAAAYGALTFIWQQGHGSDALWGIPASGAITMWVPLMVFAFLFGLSMDYEVFIIARIREAYDTSGSARDAVIEGIGRTGRLVTCAALILMLTFLSMSTAPVTDIKILATGLGAGILVDAVIVRALMVPAMVALFGRWNWWMPVWLARVLRVAPSPVAPRAAAPVRVLERAA